MKNTLRPYPSTLPRTFTLPALLLPVLAMLAFLPTRSEAQLIIGQTGSSYFSVDSASTTASYTQNASGVAFSGLQALGSTLGGLWLPQVPVQTYKDWSSIPLSDFGLMISVSGTNPNMPFTVEFYDSDLTVANTFAGSTSGATSSLGFSPLSLSLAGAGSMASIVGIQFTWDAQDVVDMQWSALAAVPEPAPVRSLVLAAAILAPVMWHRARRISRTAGFFRKPSAPGA